MKKTLKHIVLHLLCITATVIAIGTINASYALAPKPATPIITASQGIVLCNGDSVVLTANLPGATFYLWSTGATTQAIIATQKGTYTVTAGNIGGNSAPGQIILYDTHFQQDSLVWQKCLGGSGSDESSAVKQTSDGGYIIAGTTGSSDDDVSGNHGPYTNNDYWVVKLNADKSIQWQKCLGGTYYDKATAIQPTTDGGYIVAGYTNSTNGDVSGKHIGSGSSYDYWVVKLSNTGAIQWQKCLGGSEDDEATAIQQTTDGGYIVAGKTESNDGDVTGHHGNSYYDSWIVKLNSTGAIQWQKCFGGTSDDIANDIQQTNDGGYILVGYTQSINGDVSGNHSNNSVPDVWVVKIDSSGAIQWQKCLGGSNSDVGTSIQKTTSGGYIFTASTSSDDGDVSGKHNSNDAWVVKLTNTGKIQWQKCLGGSNSEWASKVEQANDGGYLVAGRTTSSDGDVSGNNGKVDCWVIKLNVSGLMEWQKCIGGSSEDYAVSLCKRTNGGYILVGITNSNDGNVTGNHGNTDLWLLQIGSKDYNPPLSGFNATIRSTNSVKLQWDTISCAEQYVVQYRIEGTTTWTTQKVTSNDGFKIINGLSTPAHYDWRIKAVYSVDSNITSDFGALQYFSTTDKPTIVSSKGTLICQQNKTVLTAIAPGASSYLWSTGATTQKITVGIGNYTLAAAGYAAQAVISIYDTLLRTPVQIEWQKCLGGSSTEYNRSIIQTSDGGYIDVGCSQSNNGDVGGNHGDYDLWVVKTDYAGIIQWQKCLGGSKFDWGSEVQQTTDGGYIVAGTTDSNNGNISGNHGASDALIVKLNKAGNIQWKKCFGGSKDDEATTIQQTTDGGYIFAGYTMSNDGDVSGNHTSVDYWVVKLTATGVIQWQKCLGGSSWNQASSIQQTTDGGYIVAGSATSNDGDVSGNHGDNDYWVVKLDNTGAIQWKKCYGGSSYDVANSIQQTLDGGYILVGITNSHDGDVSGNNGGTDGWVVKLDSSGAMLWQKCLGGTSGDDLSQIQQTLDGDYIVVGGTNSNDGDVSGNHGYSNVWVLKLDDSGNVLWQKCMGGSDNDTPSSIQQTNDGGYIVAGTTYSNNGDVTANHGDSDYWLVKLAPFTRCVPPSTGLGTSNITTTSATLNWNTVSCAEGYGVRYRVSGTTHSLSWKKVGHNVGHKTISGLLPSTTYEWQIKTFCSDATDTVSNYSALQNFTTPALREGETLSNQLHDCSVFPNPSKGNFTLSFSADEDVKGSIEIYNTLGELYYHRTIDITNGEQLYELDLTNAPSGIYALTIKSGNALYTRKLIKE